MTLLIIDDNSEFRLRISTQLRAQNVTVFGAADIIQAISTAREKRPDVILLDIELPGGDGFLVLERLKANKLLSAIPVIIVTARDPQGGGEQSPSNRGCRVSSKTGEHRQPHDCNRSGPEHLASNRRATI